MQFSCLKPIVSVGLSCAILFALSKTADARVWIIVADGSGDAATIQAGIDSAASGDCVLVHPGTYFEALDFRGKDIEVKSLAGPALTTLDARRDTSSVVIFKGWESRAAVLEGSTITGGRGSIAPGRSNRAGGGIYCVSGSPTIRGNRIFANTIASDGYASGGGIRVGTGYSDVSPHPLIVDNVIEENSAPGNGAGLGVFNAAVTATDNVFRGNRSTLDGGGAWLLTRQPCEITGNRFIENVAGDHGGAIEAAENGLGSWFVIEENLFLGNEAQSSDGSTDNGSGGAISARGMNGRIARNTFVANVGSGGPCSGGAILLSYFESPTLGIEENIIVENVGCGIACYMNADYPVVIWNNLFWNNTPSNIGSGVGVCPPVEPEDNLVADPLFCNPETDNYLLASNSPALGWGAFEDPGCGPVSVQITTWGRLKVKYKR